MGIITTAKGSRKMIGITARAYRKEMESIVGPVLLEELIRKSTLDL